MEGLDDENVDSVADLEVERIMTELTAGVFVGTGATPVGGLKKAEPVAAAAQEEEEVQEDATTQALLQRLQAL